MINLKFYLSMLVVACVLSGCDKTQADQDSALPSLSIDPAMLAITEIIEDTAETDPIAYIIHKNISKFPELQTENYPVIFFRVSNQGVYDAIGMNFEQIKQNVHDEKVINFVKSHIVAGKINEYMFYATPLLFQENYKNLLGDIIHIEVKHIKTIEDIGDTKEVEQKNNFPIPSNLLYANDVPIFSSCSRIMVPDILGNNEKEAAICTIEKALF